MSLPQYVIKSSKNKSRNKVRMIMKTLKRLFFRENKLFQLNIFHELENYAYRNEFKF